MRISNKDREIAIRIIKRAIFYSNYYATHYETYDDLITIDDINKKELENLIVKVFKIHKVVKQIKNCIAAINNIEVSLKDTKISGLNEYLGKARINLKDSLEKINNLYKEN